MFFCPLGSGTWSGPLLRGKVILSTSIRVFTCELTHSEPPTLFLFSTFALKVQTTCVYSTAQVPYVSESPSPPLSSKLPTKPPSSLGSGSLKVSPAFPLWSGILQLASIRTPLHR